MFGIFKPRQEVRPSRREQNAAAPVKDAQPKVRMAAPEAVSLIEQLRASKREPVTRYVRPADAACSLLAWLQDNGLDGWLTVPEVDAAWLVHQDDIRAGYIPIDLIRENLLSLPGVRKLRTRLNGDPQFGDVRRRLRAQRKDDSRATVIYIPPQGDAMPVVDPCDDADGPGRDRGRPRKPSPQTGHAAGHGAGRPEGSASNRGESRAGQPMAATARTCWRGRASAPSPGPTSRPAATASLARAASSRRWVTRLAGRI